MNISVIGLLTTRGHQISHKDPLKKCQCARIELFVCFCVPRLVAHAVIKIENDTHYWVLIALQQTAVLGC